MADPLNHSNCNGNGHPVPIMSGNQSIQQNQPNQDADLAHQIINNTNFSLKYEHSIIFQFFGDASKDSVTAVAFNQTSLVLMVPAKYTPQVFSESSKICSHASAILNR